MEKWGRDVLSVSTYPLADEMDDYLRHGRSVGWKDKTILNYRHHLSILVRVLRKRGCRRVADITYDDLMAVMQHVSDEGRAKKSRVQLAILCKQFFQWLQDQGKIIRNPALGLPSPDNGEPELAEPPLSEDDVQALFASLPRRTTSDLRNACLLELLYGCALRISEALALDTNDIDLSRRTLRVRGGKGGQDRLLPLMTTATAAVKDYQSVRRTLLKGPDHGALFLNQNGVRIKLSGVYGFFQDLNTARGPDARRLHPHLFRHSIAVHLLRGKADIRHVQELLGHANLDTTKHYLRLVLGHLRQDYDAAMPDIATGLAVAPHALQDI